MGRRADKDVTITCEEVIAHVFEYLDGEIDAPRRSHIKRHLEGCRACYSRTEFETALRARVHQPAPPVTPGAMRRRPRPLLYRFCGAQDRRPSSAAPSTTSVPPSAAGQHSRPRSLHTSC